MTKRALGIDVNWNDVKYVPIQHVIAMNMVHEARERLMRKANEFFLSRFRQTF